MMGVGIVFPEAETDEGEQTYRTVDLSNQVVEEPSPEDEPEDRVEGRGARGRLMSVATVLREGWIALGERRGGGEGGLAALGIGKHVDMGEILQALDHEGGRHVLVPVAGGKVPEDLLSAGVQVVRIELGRPGEVRAFADIRCMFARLADLFDDVAADMVEAAAAEPAEPVPACLRALDQWRALLRSVRSDAPRRTQIVGLMGELMVLRDIVRSDPERRADLWVGREGQRHDLRRGNIAIEVKSTTATEGRDVSIHGVQQLEEPEGGELFLAWFRFEHVPGGGITLSGLIDEIRALGVPAQLLHSGLDERGLAPGMWPDEEFELRESRFHPVDGTFPRLVPAAFRGGRVPEGVVNVSYRVDLDLAGGPMRESEVERLLERIAVMGR